MSVSNPLLTEDDQASPSSLPQDEGYDLQDVCGRSSRMLYECSLEVGGGEHALDPDTRGGTTVPASPSQHESHVGPETGPPGEELPSPPTRVLQVFFLRAPFLLTMNHTAKREAFLEPRQSSSCVFSHCSDFFCLFEKEEQIFCLVPKMQMPLCNSLRWWEAPTVVDKILMGQPIVCPQVSVFLL